MATKIEKKPVQGLNHIYLIDWYDNGIFKEIAVVKEFADGTLHGIDVDQLHRIDQIRLKKVITSVHANKYDLWELMDQTKLTNGLNMLDFFHANHIKVKRPKGAIIAGTMASVMSSNEAERPLNGFTDLSGAVPVDSPSMVV